MAKRYKINDNTVVHVDEVGYMIYTFSPNKEVMVKSVFNDIDPYPDVFFHIIISRAREKAGVLVRECRELQIVLSKDKAKSVMPILKKQVEAMISNSSEWVEVYEDAII